MKLTAELKERSGYAWVLSRLDTASPYGSAQVRAGRWYGPGEERELTGELDRVSAAMEGEQEGLCHILSRFRDISNTFRRTAGVPMDVVELFEVKCFLLTLEELAEEHGKSPLPGIRFPDMTDVLDLLDPDGRRLPVFSLGAEFEPSLARIRREKGLVEAELRAAPGVEREALLTRRRALTEEEDRGELAARKRLTDALLRERERVFAAMDTVGRLDFALARGKLARKLGCARPEISSVCTVSALNMTHPQVASALEEKGLPFTPVSVTLRKGSTVITGANMGGKSVFLRAVTLNLLLMQTGFFVFAEGFSAPLFRWAELICADGEDAGRGLSSFGGEVWRLNELLRREGPFFLALDEFARGTNPREGAALARALAGHLNGLDCAAVLTTHYDGVAPAAGGHYQAAGLGEVPPELCGEAALAALPRLMDYRLVPVPPDAPCPRDALKVCRLLGLDENLMALLGENS